MKQKLIKDEVRAFYAAAATSKMTNDCCQKSGCCHNGEEKFTMKEDYKSLAGYEPAADLALGCGIPTESALINDGDTVVDLGSGAGNDVFVASRLVGDEGKVIGIDFTPEMVVKALQNARKLNITNVDFILNDIENLIDLSDEIADVVISNCVLNLVVDKRKAFSEIYRILKPGGHFSISDIVYTGDLPDEILNSAEWYSSCIAGAQNKGEYLEIVKSTGFKNMQIAKEKLIHLPESLLSRFMNEKKNEYAAGPGFGIYSITLSAQKETSGSCCESSVGSCCGSEVTQGVSCCESEQAEPCCS